MKKPKASIKSITPLSHSNMGPVQLILFSSIFILAGGWIMSLALEVFKTSGRINAPKEILFCAGLVFALAGLSIFLQGFQNLKRRNKLNFLKKRSVNSPWNWDYEWNSKGTKNRNKNTIVSHILGLSIIGIFVYITYWIGFLVKGGTKVPFFFMLFFVLIIFLWLFNVIKKNIKYGKPYLKFNHFPFRLGQTIDIEFQNLPPREEIKHVHLFLRFYEEYETKDSKNRTRVSIRPLYEDSFEILNNEVSTKRTLQFKTELPDNPEFKSKASEYPAKFWEIQISCDIPGWDFHEYFLLPIY